MSPNTKHLHMHVWRWRRVCHSTSFAPSEHWADCFYCTLSFNQALDSLNHQIFINRVKDSKHAFGLTFRCPAQGRTHSAQVVFYLTNVFKKKGTTISTAPAMPHLYERLRACQEQVGWQRRIWTRHEFLKNEHGMLLSIAQLMSWR